MKKGIAVLVLALLLLALPGGVRGGETSAEAVYALAVRYDRGEDPAAAAEMYRLAAEMGCAPAMNGLGILYATGRGVPRDYGIAMEWYRRAAEGGSVSAMNSIGILHESGLGTEKNEEAAAEWYRRAAEGGSAEGMYRLGLMLRDGRGVEKDSAGALAWFETAGGLGHAQAMVEAGALLWEETGDDAEAVEWFVRAAAAGCPDGMLMTGITRYNDGDIEGARAWVRRAADAGSETAQFYLGLLFTGT